MSLHKHKFRDMLAKNVKMGDAVQYDGAVWLVDEPTRFEGGSVFVPLARWGIPGPGEAPIASLVVGEEEILSVCPC